MPQQFVVNHAMEHSRVEEFNIGIGILLIQKQKIFDFGKRISEMNIFETFLHSDIIVIRDIDSKWCSWTSET